MTGSRESKPEIPGGSARVPGSGRRPADRGAGRGTVLLLLLLVAGVTVRADEPRLAGFFPQIPEWKATRAPDLYQPENLYKYIDGAAELYLSYQFQELATLNYQNSRNESVDVEIYRHHDANSSFGIYSQERPARGNFLAVGAQGYVGGGVLNFFAGNFYVKLYYYGKAKDGDQILQTFARRIAEKLGPAAKMPPLLRCFPDSDKVPNSERYAAANLLGQGFLHCGFSADYDGQGRHYQLLIIEGKDAADAREMVRKYLMLDKKKAGTAVQEGGFTVEDPYNGPVVLFWRGRYIWGASGTGAPDCKALLAAIERDLRSQGFLKP